MKREELEIRYADLIAALINGSTSINSPDSNEVKLVFGGIFNIISGF